MGARATVILLEHKSKCGIKKKTLDNILVMTVVNTKMKSHHRKHCQACDCNICGQSLSHAEKVFKG